MAPLTLFLSLIWLFYGGHVLAGSSIWQPALIPGRKTLDRRYFFAAKSSGHLPWPNRVVRYCFSPDANTQAKKADIKKYLKDARKIWISKGLSSNFRIEEVNDRTCTDDRNEVLMVYYTGATGGMGTFVGFPSTSIVMPADDGPRMRLTDRIDMGMLDIVSNFAHELGHAWGLYHEHQNPAFWADVDGAQGGTVWGPNNPGEWNCHNLNDYAARVIGLVVQTGGGGNRNLNRDQLCRNFQAAAMAQFSASDYLPMSSVGTPHSSGKGGDDVDWQSLMIYPSGAGGIPTKADPVTPADDHRAPILLKPDRSRIPINLFPSTLDVEALNTMYQDIGSTKLDLLNSVANFKKVYKASDSGPSGGSGCL